jgi:hypothetical protein
MTTPEQILSEFIDAWNAGERPRARQYLSRVPQGPERDELAEGITVWLETAPSPRFTAERRAEIRREPIVADVLAAADEGRGLWPQVIPRLRTRAGLSVPQLATAIRERFGLAAGFQARTAEYLERMERGNLEPSRVSHRLLDALGDILGAGGRALADAGTLAAPPPRPAGGVLFRAEPDADRSIAADIDVLSRAATSPAPKPLDDLDRLFLGGPEG